MRRVKYSLRLTHNSRIPRKLTARPRERERISSINSLLLLPLIIVCLYVTVWFNSMNYTDFDIVAVLQLIFMYLYMLNFFYTTYFVVIILFVIIIIIIIIHCSVFFCQSSRAITIQLNLLIHTHKLTMMSLTCSD